MDMETPAAGTAQGDLADVVARAGAVMAAAAPPSSTSRRPRPPPPSSLAAAAADHMSSSSAAAAMAADHQIMAPYYDEEPRRPAACSDDAVMFDPYQLPSSARGGYSWLPPQQLALQISQHACTYASDVAMTMAAAATDVDGDEAMRIVSPAAHQIMKRKNEVKKVVCIPALPPTSSRPGGGEVIPSDLWAWRKYGQKPIKGSPYPRGYYRCSSSKGCLARKQVERSRSDPNMLVITYTAEHNHPWPMQRNVLAGYSRPHTQTSTTSSCKMIKKNSCSRAASSSSSPSPSSNNSSGNLQIECQHQQTADMMELAEGNVAAYTIIGGGALDDEEGVAMHRHQPMMSCNDHSIQTADEVFAELEELEPATSNPAASENIYSRGLSYEWHKF